MVFRPTVGPARGCGNPDVTDALRIGMDPWLGIVTLLLAISPS
jgi:hypothetical protein